MEIEQGDMVKRHVTEIRDIVAEHAVRIQKLRDLPPSRNRDVMVAHVHSECSAAILAACDHHREEANAPAEKESS